MSHCLLLARVSPEGAQRIDSANADTLTTRNVNVDTPDSRQGSAHKPAMDVVDGGYIGGSALLFYR